jgi:hypothetical protein
MFIFESDFSWIGHNKDVMIFIIKGKAGLEVRVSAAKSSQDHGLEPN